MTVPGIPYGQGYTRGYSGRHKGMTQYLSSSVSKQSRKVELLTRSGYHAEIELAPTLERGWVKEADLATANLTKTTQLCGCVWKTFAVWIEPENNVSTRGNCSRKSLLTEHEPHLKLEMI